MSADGLVLPRRALLSVTDKRDIEVIGAALNAIGCQLVSSTGTADALRAAGLPVTDTTTVSGFPPIMDNRVVTMHPKITGGILADLDEPSHVQDMADHGIESFGLVICNLYAFGQDPSIKKIDVGGPTMVRAAAKNHAHVGVVVDPDNYPQVIKQLKTGGLTPEFRRALASEAFAHTAAYDTAIATWFAGGNG